MITEQYVSFETARLLKENGFDINTDTSYVVDNTNRPAVKVGDFLYNMPRNEKHLIAAPTQALAMRWLREEKNIHINIYWLSIRKQYHSEIIEGERGSDENCDTYEDAVEYALKYCLTKLL